MRHRIESSVLLNLKNIIKDDDNMIWNSPNNMYKLDIKRYDGKGNFITDSNSGNYIIEIKVLNNIGVEIYKFRMNEIDLVRVVDSLSFYEYETGFESYASMVIGLNPLNNCSQFQTEPRIKLMRVPEYDIPPEFNNIIFNKEMEEYRDNHLTIYDYNYYTKVETPILSVYISDSELDELTYDLYFVGLIDIQLPNEAISTLETMFTRMYGYGPNGLFDSEP